jgi:hypothetical protein
MAEDKIYRFIIFVRLNFCGPDSIPGRNYKSVEKMTFLFLLRRGVPASWRLGKVRR